MRSITKTNRMSTMIIDHFMMAFLLMLFEAPFMVHNLLTLSSLDNGQMPEFFFGYNWYDVFLFSLYFNKDMLQGRSMAKRIFKFQVVDFKTNKPANSIKCLIRNLTILIWPVEVIMALINTERRLGDYIAGTKLANYEVSQNITTPNYISMIIAIPLAMLATYLLWFYPVSLLIY